MNDDFVHRNTRRKFGHDYRAPWKYHITITKATGAPVFSRLIINKLSPDGVKIELLPLGKLIQSAIHSIPDFEPHIRVYQYIIMPDHVHILLSVEEHLDRAFGIFIRGLKTQVANRWRSITNDPSATVFEPDFNDRIVYSFRNLNDIFSYIRHNPYRLAVRKMRPEFFERSRQLKIENKEMQAYGNLFLLRNPFKYALIIHRKDSDSDFEHKRKNCLHHALNGGVVVSAFISPREKALRKEIEDNGGRIIVLHNRPFSAKEKPARHDFDLCAKGRLLLIAPQNFTGKTLTRSQCLELNALAQSLANNLAP